MSQCDRILARLLAGHKLTALDALREVGCFRLGGRIYDIKAVIGDDKVRTDMIETDTGKRIAQYSILPEHRDAAYDAWRERHGNTGIRLALRDSAPSALYELEPGLRPLRLV